MGYGASSWRPVVTLERVADVTWAVRPWSSELSALSVTGNTTNAKPPISFEDGRLIKLICTLRRNHIDIEYLKELLTLSNPVLVVLGQRPKSLAVEKDMPWLTQKRKTWGRRINATSRGGPHARDRIIFLVPVWRAIAPVIRRRFFFYFRR